MLDAIRAADRALRRCWYLIAAAAIILAGLGAYSLTRPQATAVSVNEAIERFRASAEGDDTTTSVGPDGSTTTQMSDPSGATVPSVGPTSSNAATVTSVPADRLVVRRPAAGVYVYATEGGEQVSVLASSRRYPAETTRTIRHGDGCAWTTEVVFLEEHREVHTGCTTDTTLDVVGSDTVVSWFGRSQRNQLACDPPMRHLDLDVAPGTEMPFTCRDGSGSTFEGTTALTATDTFPFDGEERPVWHVRIVTTVTGRIQGTVDVTEVIDQATGLPLREERHDDLLQPTEVGTVHYTQQVVSTLTSLTPRT